MRVIVTDARIFPPVMISTCMCGQPPPIVYQTVNNGGAQDSSTPLLITMHLSSSTTAKLLASLQDGTPLSTLIYAAIRRFDRRELESFDARTGSMLGLRLSQAMFRYDFHPDASALFVSVHRKELPVSIAHGDAPFVVIFLIKPTTETIVTSRFTVASKEPSSPKGPRKAPKVWQYV